MFKKTNCKKCTNEKPSLHFIVPDWDSDESAVVECKDE